MLLMDMRYKNRKLNALFVLRIATIGVPWTCTVGVSMVVDAKRGALFLAQSAQFCHANFVTRPRVIAHLMRGLLACALAWRVGALPDSSESDALAADEDNRIQRRAARVLSCRQPGELLLLALSSHAVQPAHSQGISGMERRPPQLSAQACGNPRVRNDPRLTLYWGRRPASLIPPSIGQQLATDSENL